MLLSFCHSHGVRSEGTYSEFLVDFGWFCPDSDIVVDDEVMRQLKGDDTLANCFLIAPFNITSIADIFRHPSFDMLNNQDRSKSTNHSPLA